MSRPRRFYPCLLRMDAVEDKRHSRSLVMVVAKDRQRFEVFCACDQRRDDAGLCRHLQRYWPLIKPWYRSRMTIVPRDWQQAREASDGAPAPDFIPLTEQPRRMAERWVW